MERALITPPRVVDDPAWERSVLGPFVARARRLLFAQLASGDARNDPRAALLRAHRCVPFYQRAFARAALGRNDLRNARALPSVPRTRRSDLASGVEQFLAHPVAPLALDRGWLGRTSGSTGEPLSYLRDPRTHAWFWAFLDFALAYGTRRRLSASGRPVMLLDALEHMPEYDADLPLFHGARFVKRSARNCAGIVAADPQIVTGDPESLAALAELDIRPDLVLSSAFAMPAALAEAIRARTGAVVLSYYATQETSVIGIECRDGHGYHPLAGACHVEVIDGEVSVTTLNNPSFLLIRYSPGDLAALDDAECPCGLRGPRIATLAGRTNVRFRGRCGDYAAGSVAPLLARLPVLEHQLVWRAPDRFALRYRGGSIDDGQIEPLRVRLAELAGAPVTVSLEAVTSIPRRGRKPEPYAIEGA